MHLVKEALSALFNEGTHVLMLADMRVAEDAACRMLFR